MMLNRLEKAKSMSDLMMRSYQSGILQEIKAELILVMDENEVEEFIRLINGFENLKMLKIEVINNEKGVKKNVQR
jgi:hypothetical protein